MAGDEDRIAELTAIVQAVRDRVRSRYPLPESAQDGEIPLPESLRPAIRIPVADLLPIVHARDAAQARIASIGSVNPRAGGIANAVIQAVKKTIARSLQWFVRDQVTFNREAVSALESVLEALNEHNRILISLAAQTSEQIGYARAETVAASRDLSARIEAAEKELASAIEAVGSRIEPLRAEAAELKDVRKHWIEWRAAWEQKLSTNEIQFLRSAADLQGAFQHRATQMELNFRDIVKSQHTDYLGALDRATLDIQKRLWHDLAKIQAEYERTIHTELRLIRQRARTTGTADAVPAGLPAVAGDGAAPSKSTLDYARFAERFRGPEESVRRGQEIYKPVFAECVNVLDIGCGRGEFLGLMGELGVHARGIDLSEESVSCCRGKGLDAEAADLFEYLGKQPDGEFDGIFCSQVVEHLAPERLPDMIALCAAKLRRSGVLAIETPNPECLAIFATHFYLDPTHTRPVPHQLLEFYLVESGCVVTSLHRLADASESIPEVTGLPEAFRARFFGGLDYAIVARKL